MMEVDRVRLYRNFLNKVFDSLPLIFDENSDRRSDDYIREAARRYEHIWIPLLRKANKRDLTPPLDIQWIWHLHRLDSGRFWDKGTHSDDLLRQDLLCDPPTARLERLKKTRDIWLNQFPSEPFFNENWKNSTGQKESKLSSDFVALNKEHRGFWYQISLPHFDDTKFLESSVRRYERYMRISLANPEVTRQPFIDIEFLRRTNLVLSPSSYHQRFARTLLLENEKPYYHEPFLLNPDFNVLWSKDQEGHPEPVEHEDHRKPADPLTPGAQHKKPPLPVNYSIAGAFYCKQPPYHLLSVTSEQVFELSRKTCVFCLTSIKVEGLTNNSKNAIKIKIYFHSRKGTVDLCEKVWESRHSKRKPTAECEWSEENRCGLVRFRIQRGVNEKIVFHIWKRKKVVGPVNFPKRVGGHREKIVFDLDVVDRAKHCEKATRLFNSKLKIIVKWEQYDIQREDCELWLSRGNFFRGILPDTVDGLSNFLGPMMWLPSKEDKVFKEVRLRHCIVANHAMNSLSDLDFDCRIIHSNSLMTSVVQIRLNNKLMAIAHLLNQKHLPLTTQVSQRRVPAVDPKEQLAKFVLIKNRLGNWGVIKAVWAAAPKPRRPAAGAKPQPPSLNCTLYLLNGSGIVHDFKCKPSGWIDIKGFKFNLRSGYFMIPKTLDELSEFVALGFSVAVLLTLCRMDGPTRSRNLKLPTELNAFLPEIKHGSKLIMAVGHGYEKEMPSNSNLLTQQYSAKKARDKQDEENEMMTGGGGDNDDGMDDTSDTEIVHSDDEGGGGNVFHRDDEAETYEVLMNDPILGNAPIFIAAPEDAEELDQLVEELHLMAPAEATEEQEDEQDEYYGDDLDDEYADDYDDDVFADDDEMMDDEFYGEDEFGAEADDNDSMGGGDESGGGDSGGGDEGGGDED